MLNLFTLQIFIIQCVVVILGEVDLGFLNSKIIIPSCIIVNVRGHAEPSQPPRTTGRSRMYVSDPTAIVIPLLPSRGLGLLVMLLPIS